MQQLEVNGKVLRVRKLNTRRGLRIFAKLTKIVGPAFAAAKGGGTWVDALTVFFERATVDDLDWLVDAFIPYTDLKVTDHAKGFIPLSSKADLFDNTFGTDYKAVLEWLKLCIEVNYSDFLASIGLRKLPDLPTPEQSESESQTELNG